MIEKNLLEKGTITTKEAAELLDALVKKELGGEMEKQNLMDKLYEAKVKEIKKNEVLAKEKVRELNAKKKKLLEVEQTVLEEKAKQQYLNSRGLDFLVEVELGNGPDLEDIKKNIEVETGLYSIVI
jgi:phenylalanine-4-hydroxylase